MIRGSALILFLLCLLLGAMHYAHCANLFLKTKPYISFSCAFFFFPLVFTTRVAECFSELNHLSSKNVTCYFHSRHKKLRHTGMEIQRYLIHFGNPTFNALSSFCASTTVPIIFTNDICDSEPHLKVKQEEA